MSEGSSGSGLFREKAVASIDSVERFDEAIVIVRAATLWPWEFQLRPSVRLSYLVCRPRDVPMTSRKRDTLAMSLVRTRITRVHIKRMTFVRPLHPGTVGARGDCEPALCGRSIARSKF